MAESAPVTKRRAQTRARLMDAAIDAFAERGVMAASVEDICERAGYTRGAFYSNFADKEELVLALLDQQISDVVERAHQVIGDSLAEPSQEDSATLIEHAAEAFSRAARPVTREWIIVQEELRLYALRNPETFEKYNVLERETIGNVRDLLTDALAKVGREFALPTNEAIEILGAVQKQHSLDALMPTEPGVYRESAPSLTTLLLLLTRPTG
ncbi:TetR/AcrR family transcriptional regulator [Spelaeicoccus albus]|uniref:AcrR family transcriptional regulator n=1 Tax=Spelaeicoccus albus TaxID=1280376 RepID=A0A7Z0D248_9MICO|nr:TetR family transcriptional regulator [Spelaeicoccus albus]NYI67466.1 AcrR family transcriptional regulator [Spelaeicoccus albus]